MEEVEPSEMATRTVNPIRRIVDQLRVPEAPGSKPFIPLSIGDPTVFRNLPRCAAAAKAVQEAAAKGDHDGYPPAAGYAYVREALAKRFSATHGPIAMGQVYLTSGCSHALDLVLSSLCNPGDTVLLPRPGFSLYSVICSSYGIAFAEYDLLPEQRWEADLNALERAITPTTKAILINNPSNPCGSVFSKEHLLAILAVAEKHGLVIIADEIYDNLVFGDNVFHPCASLSTNVPVLTVGGIAKQYLVPGWRVGWILVCDRHQRLVKYNRGLNQLSQRILGPNSLTQAAVPAILATPASWTTSLVKTLEEHADLCFDRLSAIPGLAPVRPQGAMYIMTRVDLSRFPQLQTDTEFTQKLLDEEFVMVLPGTAFGAPGYVRIVFCAPLPKLEEAMARVAAFCGRHTALQ